MVRNGGTCYVGHLTDSVSEADLFILFSQVGPVQSVRIVLDPVTKESRGYAYVNFFLDGDYSPVEEAIRRLNYTELKGQQITVMVPEKDVEKRKRGEGNIFVKGLEPEIDSQTLHDTFDIFGPVTSAKVVRGADGKSLGYGYVQFFDPEAATEAVTRANHMMLKERMISVERFIPRQERKNQTYTNLFIKNFPPSIQHQDHLAALFGKFGKITSAFLPVKEEGGVKGFGFVNFENTKSAAAATKEMHEKEVDGAVLYVQRAQTRAERRKYLEKKYREQKRTRDKEYKGRNLYVKNFPQNTTDEDLFRLFSQFGTITSAKVMTENGQPRGFGFVCFATTKEASTALNAMNGHMFEDKELYVNIAQSREERKRILRRLRNAISYHNATTFPGQPFFYSPSIPIPPVSVFSPAGGTQSPDYTPLSQMLGAYSSSPFPLPMMVPPAVVHDEEKANKGEKWLHSPVASWSKRWTLELKDSAEEMHLRDCMDASNEEYSMIPTELSCALYGRVSRGEKNERLAQKITGMLLDLGKEEVESMMNDENLLTRRIEDSILVLKNAGMMKGLSSSQEITSYETIKAT